jgi:hypothetical protein
MVGKLCSNCHFDGGPATDVDTHSSKTITGANVARDGNWDLDCWACHNPHTQEQNIEYGSTYGKYVKNDFGTSFTSQSPTTVKEINPADPGPYYTPIGTIRTITSDEVEFTSNTGFVDSDGLTEDDICQVCHANTNNYSTGAVDSHSDYGPDSQPGGNCTSSCHLHTAGFSGAGGDCTTCHSAAQNSTDLYRRQVVSTGGDFERAKHHVTDGSATEVVTADDCVVCHNQSNHTTWGDDPVADAGYKVSLNDVSQAAGATITYDGTGASIEGFCLGCHNATGPHDDYDYDNSPDGINEPFTDGTDPQDINTDWSGSTSMTLTGTPASIGAATCTANCNDDTPTSGGTYTGPDDGTYTVTTTGGNSGSATLTCTSDITGDTSCGFDTWNDNTPVAIGIYGVTLNIDDTIAWDTGTDLANGYSVDIPVTAEVTGGTVDYFTAHNTTASSSLPTEACLTCHGGSDSTVTETVTDHNVHGATNDFMLSGLIDGATVTNTEEEVCFACHDATGNASTDIETAVSATYHHSPTDGTNPVECLECHNPHAANSAPKQPSGTNVPNLPGALTGVPGVDASGTPVAVASEEYEICFRCHGDSGVAVTPLARLMNSTNLRVDFDSANPTHHAVVGAGADSSVPSLVAPYDVGDRIYCTDCHMDTSGLNGPHGSDNPYLLKARYDLNTGGSGTTAEKWALCFQCHNTNVTGSDYTGVMGTHFNSGRSHDRPCSWCHDPHGMNSATNPGYTGVRQSLINFRTDMPAILTDDGGAFIWGGTGDRGGSGCQLSCHGRGH